MQAVYDLSRYPANFNFFEFLVAATTLGAKHIVFDDTSGYLPKYSRKDLGERVKSILEPACALAGCTFSYGRGKGLDPGYHIDVVVKAFHETGGIKRLVSVNPPAKVDYTVTLRNSKRYPERNSSDDWRRFADEIGAVVIEDYGDKPIHMHDRMALYCGAKMNFTVANGPMYLCMFSEAPYMAFMKNVNPVYHTEHEFPVGSQLPWAVKNQTCVWSGDSYDEIKSAWGRQSGGL